MRFIVSVSGPTARDGRLLRSCFVRQSAPLTFVKQQHDRGCMVACVAMLTGRSYEGVLNDQIRMAGDLSGVFSLRFHDWRVYLSYLGFETGMYDAEGPLLDVTSELPKGVRFLCGIGTPEDHPKYLSGNSHVVVLDETGDSPRNCSLRSKINFARQVA